MLFIIYRINLFQEKKLFLTASSSSFLFRITYSGCFNGNRMASDGTSNLLLRFVVCVALGSPKPIFVTRLTDG